MNKLCFAGLLLLLLCSAAAAQEELPPPWARFEPQGVGFSVIMPGKPVETITKRTNYTLHSFTVTLGRTIFSATYSDYTTNLDPNKSITANIEKFNKSLDARPLTTREVTLDGHSGVEFTAETDALNVKSRVFVIGKRMFQVVALAFKDVDDSRNVDRFFDSFKFTAAK